jgi:hypothetical protein
MIYLYAGDVYLNKWKIDIETLREIGRKTILGGFRHKDSIPQQLEKYKAVMNDFIKMRNNCYKIKRREHHMLLGAWSALFKLNVFNEFDDLIYLKNKKKSA